MRLRECAPAPLSYRIQPPAPPLMHRLHQCLGTLVRALLHLPTVRYSVFADYSLPGDDSGGREKKSLDLKIFYSKKSKVGINV